MSTLSGGFICACVLLLLPAGALGTAGRSGAPQGTDNLFGSGLSEGILMLLSGNKLKLKKNLNFVGSAS